MAAKQHERMMFMMILVDISVLLYGSYVAWKDIMTVREAALLVVIAANIASYFFLIKTLETKIEKVI